MAGRGPGFRPAPPGTPAHPPLVAPMTRDPRAPAPGPGARAPAFTPSKGETP
jgi:hypothetical protein